MFYPDNKAPITRISPGEPSQSRTMLDGMSYSPQSSQVSSKKSVRQNHEACNENY